MTQLPTVTLGSAAFLTGGPREKNGSHSNVSASSGSWALLTDVSQSTGFPDFCPPPHRGKLSAHTLYWGRQAPRSFLFNHKM